MKKLSMIILAITVITFLTVILYAMEVTSLDLMLQWMYVVFGLSILSVIVFPGITLIQNPKSALSSLSALLILVAVIAVCYLFASDAPVITPSNVYDSPGSLKFSDTILFTTYVTSIGTIVTLICAEVYSATR